MGAEIGVGGGERKKSGVGMQLSRFFSSGTFDFKEVAPQQFCNKVGG